MSLSAWDIKKKLGENGIKAYELASFLNITESAFSKRLRTASPEQLKEISSACDEYIKQKKAS